MRPDQINLAHGKVNEIKNGTIKKRKRKFSSENEEALAVHNESDIIKKPSKLKKRDLKILKYCKTDNYVKCVAKPEGLPSTPKIFQKYKHNIKKNKTGYGLSDSFMYNVVSKCYDSNIHHRFNCISKLNDEKIQENSDNEMTNGEEVVFSKPKTKESLQKCKEKKAKITKKPNQEFSESEANQSDKEISETTESNINLYEAINQKGLIFHMHHPCSFSFSGEIRVTIISGEVEILGFTLNEFSQVKTVNVFSPNFFTPLVIESKPLDLAKNYDKIRSCLVNILNEEEVNQLLSKMNPNDSVLLVEQIVSNFGCVINKYFDKQLFPKDLENLSLESETLKILQSTFNFKTTKNFRQYKKNTEWDKIPLDSCTVFCGGKGVGKSTLLKYYVNKLVAKGEKVLCLDFDPGQPEFTPPGCLSAVVVDSPLLGPNFTHLLNPNLMVYFGEVDVSQNPMEYLKCVKYVIESCQKNQEFLKLRWFVNTMGFCKGLGVELMITIIKLLKPMSVIQIQSSDFKRNFPFYLTSASVNSRKGFLFIDEEKEPLHFDLRVVKSQAEINGIALHGGLKSNKLREVALMSYFSQMVFPPNYNFNGVQPYFISFSKLYLGIDFLISPNDVLKAFNCNIVSLSLFEPGGEEILFPENEEYFKIVIKPETNSCAALGFVRGIDCIQKKFYVVTPLPMKELEKINCLTLGKISPPQPLILNQRSLTGQTFYTSVSTVKVTKRVKRTFRIQSPEKTKFKSKLSV